METQTHGRRGHESTVGGGWHASRERADMTVRPCSLAINTSSNPTQVVPLVAQVVCLFILPLTQSNMIRKEAKPQARNLHLTCEQATANLWTHQQTATTKHTVTYTLGTARNRVLLATCDIIINSALCSQGTLVHFFPPATLPMSLLKGGGSDASPG